MSRSDARAGLGVGDALLILAALAVVAALVLPRVRRTDHRERALVATAQVEAVREAAERFRAEHDAWPEPAEAGRVPRELVPLLPAGFTFDAGAWRLELNRWESVEGPPPLVPEDVPPSADLRAPPDTGAAPAPVVGARGGVTVHTRDEALLADLLQHYGAGRSFVRDSSWTLVFR